MGRLIQLEGGLMCVQGSDYSKEKCFSGVQRWAS